MYVPLQQHLVLNEGAFNLGMVQVHKENDGMSNINALNLQHPGYESPGWRVWRSIQQRLTTSKENLNPLCLFNENTYLGLQGWVKVI